MSLDSLVNALAEGCRLVDLSAEVHPGIMYATATTAGAVSGAAELKQWISMGNHYQTFIDAGSHVGTHVDMPVSHPPGRQGAGRRRPGGGRHAAPDLLRTGDRDRLQRARHGRRPASVEVGHLDKVRAGDIVLLWSTRRGREQPSLSLEAARYLADLPIKMIGVQGRVRHDQHVALLGKAGGPVPIIEELEHCEELRAERFLFLGLPMRVHHLEASWIRAVAFEPRVGPGPPTAGRCAARSSRTGR